MKRSDQRILTTHVGSLPRARALSDLLIAQEDKRPVDQAELDRLAREGVRHVVAQQLASGLDIINDGEQPRVGFQTYVGQRLEGFGGVSEREPFTDFAQYPDFRQVWLNRGMVMSKVFDAPAANAEVRYRDLAPAIRECDMFDDALAQHRGKVVETFMTAASPGIVCTTMRNAGFYDSHASKDKILIPGVIDSTVNYIEHQQVVCNRILEAVDAVGDRERVIAGADCGFGTFAGWEMVAASVVWKKFAAMAEGARLASQKLWS